MGGTSGPGARKASMIHAKKHNQKLFSPLGTLPTPGPSDVMSVDQLTSPESMRSHLKKGLSRSLGLGKGEGGLGGVGHQQPFVPGHD
jgi:hypothetical protein